MLNKMNIDTFEVLNAAKTKWNFLDFQPGFVGGHCVAIDPYYLTYKAKKVGVNFIAYNCKIGSKEIKVDKKVKIINE